ncbi:MAG: glucose-6-phosphate dehydrogenase assembly protein OpcA [Actinomycetota bacterium]|nr:glucose-6-phosphate dehydrogenase assembly protein OpcA [Actinomycetota bacterium]
MTPGPEVTTLGSWEADNVTLGQVETELSNLRRHEQRAAVRTSVLTLVAVVDSPTEAALVWGIVHDLGIRHPSRTIVLDVGDHGGEGSGVDASVWVQAVEKEGRAVCFEDLLLTVRGKGRHHLDSIVEPFALADVPMVVWLPARLPSAGDPLMAAANRVVVDSRAVKEAGVDALARSLVLSRRLPVTDLSWIRLAPWRSLLAGLFEGAVYRPFLDGVQRVEIAGNDGPRHLLGGWLVRRLGLPANVVRLTPADHVSVRIEAVADGRSGTFSVLRPGAERVIHACVDIEDGPSLEQIVNMREQWPSLALAGALTRVGHDTVYEEALAGARDLRS